jgi:hypothetical protein
MTPANLKLIAYALVSIALFAAGYNVRGAFEAKEKLAIEQAKAAFTKIYQDGEAVHAEILQKKLDALKANERVINNETVKVITRDVYRNECLDNDGVQLIERARAGQADPEKPP